METSLLEAMPHVTLNNCQEAAVEAIARAGAKIAVRRDFVRRSREFGEFAPIGLRARVLISAIRD